MTIDATNFDGGAHLAVQLGVAMGVLTEMAVGAVHSLFHMHIHKVDGRMLTTLADPLLLAGRRVHGTHELCVFHLLERLALVVQQVALAIFLVDGSEYPPVAMKIRKLRVPQMRVQIGDVGQKLGVRPEAAGRSIVGIVHLGLGELFRSQLFLLDRIHQLAIGLIVPPHIANIAIQHVRAGMDVADDALTGGDRQRKFVRDGMPRFVLGYRRIG